MPIVFQFGHKSDFPKVFLLIFTKITFVKPNTIVNKNSTVQHNEQLNIRF